MIIPKSQLRGKIDYFPIALLEQKQKKIDTKTQREQSAIR